MSIMQALTFIEARIGKDELRTRLQAKRAPDNIILRPAYDCIMEIMGEVHEKEMADELHASTATL